METCYTNTLDEIKAVISGSHPTLNAYSNVTAEHAAWADSLPLVTAKEASDKVASDALLIEQVFSRSWAGGYMDYEDHRKDSDAKLKKLAKKHKLYCGQYIWFFRQGLPTCLIVSGYRGGISITQGFN